MNHSVDQLRMLSIALSSLTYRLLHPRRQNIHSSQVYLEPYPGQTLCWAIKQVSVNLK